MASSTTLSASVAASLRESLLRGSYLCGDRLSEIGLAHEIGVSQNTVRDALGLLEQDGWVVKLPRRGVFVRSFSRDEADEVYTLLAAVERVALNWAMERMTRTRLLELRRVLNRARRAAQNDDEYAAVDALFTFHEVIAGSAGKRLTSDLLARLYNYARLLEALRRARTAHDPEQLDAQIAAHDRLHKLMERGDREAVLAALDEMVVNYREAVLPVLADEHRTSGR